jgi:hypothetical protein
MANLRHFGENSEHFLAYPVSTYRTADDMQAWAGGPRCTDRVTRKRLVCFLRVPVPPSPGYLLQGPLVFPSQSGFGTQLFFDPRHTSGTRLGSLVKAVSAVKAERSTEIRFNRKDDRIWRYLHRVLIARWPACSSELTARSSKLYHRVSVMMHQQGQLIRINGRSNFGLSLLIPKHAHRIGQCKELVH